MSEVRQDALIAQVEANWPLLDRPRWWLWKGQRRTSGGLGKAPVRVGFGGALIPHAPGDSRAWRSWSAVRDDYLTGRGDGVAYVLGEGLACLDLDNCLDADGVPDATAAELLAEMTGYAERSPSGQGLHFLAWTPLTVPTRNQRAGQVELLRTGLVTVTGHAWPGHAGAPSSSAALSQAWARRVGETHQTLPVPSLAARSPPEIGVLLSTAARLRNAGRFFSLWHGNTHHHRSPSEADFALCRHLYFHLGPDPHAIYQVFQESGLYQQRPRNWHRRAITGPPAVTYGQLTVRRAVACGGPTLSRAFP